MLLASRFGTGSNRMQVRQIFATRQQSAKEDWMQYLDALEVEGLCSQGFPDEPVTTMRYEIYRGCPLRCLATGTLYHLRIRNRRN